MTLLLLTRPANFCALMVLSPERQNPSALNPRTTLSLKLVDLSHAHHMTRPYDYPTLIASLHPMVLSFHSIRLIPSSESQNLSALIHGLMVAYSHLIALHSRFWTTQSQHAVVLERKTLTWGSSSLLPSNNHHCSVSPNSLASSSDSDSSSAST